MTPSVMLWPRTAYRRNFGSAVTVTADRVTVFVVLWQVLVCIVEDVQDRVGRVGGHLSLLLDGGNQIHGLKDPPASLLDCGNHLLTLFDSASRPHSLGGRILGGESSLKVRTSGLLVFKTDLSRTESLNCPGLGLPGPHQGHV